MQCEAQLVRASQLVGCRLSVSEPLSVGSAEGSGRTQPVGLEYNHLLNASSESRATNIYRKCLLNKYKV